MRGAQTLFALNRGVVSPLALARSDVKKLALAAQTQTNWLPRVLGPMMLRPGRSYLGSTASNLAARYLKFIFATDDTALLELTNQAMRVWIDDVLLTRPVVTTTITNGTFAGNITGWTDMDEAGAVSQWAAGNLMQLVGTGSSFAIREQQVTVAGGNIGLEHGVRVVVGRGPVTITIGSTSGGEDYLKETDLNTGEHSLSITPSGNFFIRFFSRRAFSVLLNGCTMEAAGVVTLTTPWTAAKLQDVRSAQSGDVLFVACKGLQQRRIERRGTRPGARSWSVVLYQADNGPFQVPNTTPTTINASGITGTVDLGASAPLFKSTHLGALFSITSAGQQVTAAGAANGVTTSSIVVTGVGSDRVFSIEISGDATGSTVNLQRSYDNSTWSTIGAPESWTANVTTTYNDSLDNQIVYYRLILATRVAPDSVTMVLRIGSGSKRGVVRINGVVSSVLAIADVLTDLGGTSSSANWQESNWSDERGWPTSVCLHEGRLWWAGQNGVWGSVSDDYVSFDETTLGNSGPINRTIGSGPVDTINWLVSLKGLALGAQGAEHVARASSLDEPLTPNNFNVKSPSTQGSGSVEAIKADQTAYFVNRSGVKVFSFTYSAGDGDYVANCLMELVPEIGQPGIVRMDVQRLPDTRIHCVRSDGTAVVAIINRVEEVLAWVPVETSGFIEDVVILPALDGNLDDQVYYVVKRTISGATVRYLEKWAQEEDCQGGALNCQADAYVTYTGAAATVIAGLTHLEGEEVVVWANGQDVGTNDSARPWTQRYTVAGGQITLAAAATNVVVGLGYSAQFKSAKLALAVQGAMPLNRHKKLDHVGFVLVNTHPKGVRFGPTLDETGSMAMDDMPAIERGTDAGTAVIQDYDEDMIEFPGTWTTDARVCLLAQAPRPATVLAISLTGSQN